MKTTKKFHVIWSLLAAAALLFAGCGDDENYTYSTSSECIVSAVTLGTLNCKVHTPSSTGEDSTYIITVQGYYYPMSIDQQNNRIFNRDSLPVETDVQRVVFTTFSTTGYATIKTLESRADTLFNYTDSTDFSVPREITVIATDGVSKRTYTMELRVHKEWGDSATWNRLGTNATLAAATRQRALVKDGTVYDFALCGGMPKLLTASTEMPSEWASADIGRSDLDVRSVQLHDGLFYAMTTAGALVTSANGTDWADAATPQMPEGARTLVASGSRQLTALGDCAIFSSQDGGTTWQTDELSDDATLLPAPAEAACVRLASSVDSQYESLLMVGTKDGAATIWKHDIDLTGETSHAWFHYPAIADSAHACPALAHATLLPYDGGALLLGTTADGSPSKLYMSTDNGRTWNPSYMKTPALGRAASLAAAVDEHHNIYILCGGTGEVWRGRINRLGWKQEPDSFTR